MIKDIFGSILILTGLFDAWKYVWQAKAIIKVGTARGHSRKFLNVALGNDLIKLVYSIIILDIFIFLSSLLALGTMIYNFIIVYLYYPYRNRNLINFRKPSLIKYLINSFSPNSQRKRL